MADNNQEELTPEQIALANHVNLRALEALLIKRKVFSPEELHEEIQRVYTEMTGGQ